MITGGIENIGILYGGASSSASPVYFTNICECVTYDLNRVDGVGSGVCVGTTYCYSLDKLAGKTSAYICIYCNGVCIRGCGISGVASCTKSGAFTSFVQTSSDCVCVCTRALDVLGDSYAYSCIWLANIIQCVGCFCIGAPSAASSFAGMAV